jgi:hypothetical protein
MSNQMMHANKWQAAGIRKGFSEAQPNQQRANQARPRRHGDAVEFIRPDARLFERFLDDSRDHANMVSGRQLRHDTTIRRMNIGLPMNDARQDL